jgi:hypothetical protein
MIIAQSIYLDVRAERQIGHRAADPGDGHNFGSRLMVGDRSRELSVAEPSFAPWLVQSSRALCVEGSFNLLRALSTNGRTTS